MTSEQLVKRLRRVADLYEKYPDLPEPFSILGEEADISFYTNRDAFTKAVRQIGGEKKVSAGGGYIGVVQDIGDGVKVFLNMNREVLCERVVTGTWKVKRAVETVPAQTEEREVEEEIVEWRCPESLLASEDVS